jgi:hypothetical protein
VTIYSDECRGTVNLNNKFLKGRSSGNEEARRLGDEERRQGKSNFRFRITTSVDGVVDEVPTLKNFSLVADNEAKKDRAFVPEVS